jgi:hypothetical protein
MRAPASGSWVGSPAAEWRALLLGRREFLLGVGALGVGALMPSCGSSPPAASTGFFDDFRSVRSPDPDEP